MVDDISRLCKGKKIVELKEPEEEDIKPREIKFVDQGKQQAFLGLFGATNNDDDDDEDDEELILRC